MRNRKNGRQEASRQQAMSLHVSLNHQISVERFAFTNQMTTKIPVSLAASETQAVEWLPSK
jgi:hypothetical protein